MTWPPRLPATLGVYALAHAFTDQYHDVFRYDTNAHSWSPASLGRAKKLYGGGFGLFAMMSHVLNDRTTIDTLHQYTGDPPQWLDLGGNCVAGVVTDDAFYGVFTTGQRLVSPYVSRFDGTTWTPLGFDGAKEVYGGGYGVFAVARGSGEIYRYLDNMNWQIVGGPGHMFAVTHEGLYGLSPDRTRIFRWDGHGQSWTEISPAVADFTALYGSRYGLFAVQETGQIYQHQSGNTWIARPGALVGNISALTEEAFYGVASDGQVVRYRGSGWAILRGQRAADIVAAPRELVHT